MPCGARISRDLGLESPCRENGTEIQSVGHCTRFGPKDAPLGPPHFYPRGPILVRRGSRFILRCRHHTFANVFSRSLARMGSRGRWATGHCTARAINTGWRLLPILAFPETFRTESTCSVVFVGPPQCSAVLRRAGARARHDASHVMKALFYVVRGVNRALLLNTVLYGAVPRSSFVSLYN